MLDPGRRRVGVFFHRRVAASRALAAELVASMEARGAQAQLLDSWEPREVLAARLGGLDWAAVLGGDGTVLRIAGLLAPLGVPVLGVNFGRLGFLTELSAEEAQGAMDRVLAGEGWVEERLMLAVGASEVLRPAPGDPDRSLPGDGTAPLVPGGRSPAVNDVFIGRGRVAHAVRLAVAVDGEPLIQLTADGVIIATPTGSTAYSLSAGGPVVDPRLAAIVLTPVVPHPVPVRSLILPSHARIEVTVRTDEEAICSVDGQRHYILPDGATIRVQAAEQAARFLHLAAPGDFYRTLIRRLG